MHHHISEDQVEPSLMRTFQVDKDDCAVMSRKRSLESGSCEDVGVSHNCKRLTVDQVHQSQTPQPKYKKIGSERRISTLELPGTSAPADATCKVTEQLVSYGEEVVGRTERRTERKTEMRPPKVIREAVSGRMKADDFPREMHFSGENRQVSSFSPWMDSRPSQTSGRLDCVSSSECDFSRNYQADLCRDQVRKVLDLYKDTLERLRQDNKVKTYGKRKIGMQIYVDAAMQLKDHKKWLNVDKCVGALPGIEIGDQFQSRAELVIVGLHSKFLAGIDYKNIGGKFCATSIVTSGRHGDKNDSSDVLIYVGEGGKPNRSSEKPEDQKLVRGNLALKNSINDVPVRVIRRIQNMKAPKLTLADSVNKSNFVYDGLYFVRKCWSEREHCGNLVYKFQLERIQGQQELPKWNTENASRKFNKATNCPVVCHDISKGEENIPVRVVNAVDCQKPPPFKYTTKMAYHSQQCVVSKSSGCDCLDGCSKEILCSCIDKSNGKVSMNNSVSVVKKDHVVHECGPCCKCPPDCKNRMSQHGIKLQLEVFKTIPTGWGVRSRNFISEGRFICEYVGEMLQYKEDEGIIDFDQSAVDAGNSDDAKTVMFGNVARFIRHSCSPNLYAKCVLFDHEDMRRPHVMLFAARNIPPRKELTFDYQLP